MFVAEHSTCKCYVLQRSSRARRNRDSRCRERPVTTTTTNHAQESYRYELRTPYSIRTPKQSDTGRTFATFMIQSTPEQGSSLRRRTDDTHVGEVYTYTSTWLYICIQLCTVNNISIFPSDPYEAVLQNLGAYKSIFPHPQQQRHHHCNKTCLLKTQQNGPSITF